MTGSTPAILIHCTTKVLWQTMYWHYRIVHLPLTFSEIYTNRVDSFFFLVAFEYLAFTRWVHLPPLNHTFCKYPSHCLCAALWMLIQLFGLKFARFVQKNWFIPGTFPYKKSKQIHVRSRILFYCLHNCQEFAYRAACTEVQQQLTPGVLRQQWFWVHPCKKSIFDHPTFVSVWFWPSNSKTGYLCHRTIKTVQI